MCEDAMSLAPRITALWPAVDPAAHAVCSSDVTASQSSLPRGIDIFSRYISFNSLIVRKLTLELNFVT